MKALCTKLLLLLLCLSICIGVFIGCSDDDDDNDNTVNTVEGKGEDRFKTTDFGGETIKICMSDYKGPERSTTPSKYMTGTQESTSDNIIIAINERNEYIEEKLKLNVSYSYIDDAWDEIYDTLVKMYQANTDIPDAVTNQGQAMIMTMMSDIFMNCNTDDYTNYFDFTDGFWYADAMSAYAFGNDVTKADTGTYILIGDYFIDYISNIWTMFVNEEVLTSHTSWSTDDFYSFVKEGDWTWDVLMSIAATVFEDHQDVEDNRNGYLFASNNVGTCFYSRGVQQHTHTADIDIMTFENGRYYFNSDNINSSYHALVDKMLEVTSAKGCVGRHCTDIQDYCARIYAKNNTLFSAFHLYDLESDIFSGLEICPIVMPKFSADHDYRSVSEETASLGAIFNSTEKFEEISAYWQYQNLISNKTRETYYVDGLGLKYETGANTKEMLDLIYDSIVPAPAYVIVRYFYSEGNHDAVIVNLMGDSLRARSNMVASMWESMKTHATTALDTAIAKYNKLHR